MNVTQTSTGYVLSLDATERDQVLLALEIAAACRRGDEGRGVLIRQVNSTLADRLADVLTSPTPLWGSAALPHTA